MYNVSIARNRRVTTCSAEAPTYTVDAITAATIKKNTPTAPTTISAQTVSGLPKIAIEKTYVGTMTSRRAATSRKPTLPMLSEGVSDVALMTLKL